MRLSTPSIVLLSALALAGCGDDEPEQATIPRPPATQRARPDTTASDSARQAARAGLERNGQQAAGQTGQPGGETGQSGQAQGVPGAPGGDAGGQAGRTDQAGQAGQAGAAGRAGSEAGSPGGRLYTVQVAAFTSPDSAQKWTRRLGSLDLPVWMSMTELGGATYYRVRVGAVASVTDARRLGAVISRRFEWPVWVAPVTPSDRMPDDAVADTRRLLGGE